CCQLKENSDARRVRKNCAGHLEKLEFRRRLRWYQKRRNNVKTKLLTIIAGLLAGWFSPQPLQARELKDLKVLYIGSERTDQFVPFLKKHVAQVDTSKRSSFNAADAEGFDVVLLDWPQGEETREMRKLRSPLGSREEW